MLPAPEPGRATPPALQAAGGARQQRQVRPVGCLALVRLYETANRRVLTGLDTREDVLQLARRTRWRCERTPTGAVLPAFKVASDAIK